MEYAAHFLVFLLKRSSVTDSLLILDRYCVSPNQNSIKVSVVKWGNYTNEGAQ